MCNNPYPAENLNEAAWNQMVLKAFFTEKPIDQIIGLDERANERLARTLSDYAHERWAAHRSVNPLLWRCVAPFINEQMLYVQALNGASQRCIIDVKKPVTKKHTYKRYTATLYLLSKGGLFLPGTVNGLSRHRR